MKIGGIRWESLTAAIGAFVTANPAKLVTLGSGFASEGTYTSDLIDAGQPATWGKLQLEASIPQGCKVLLAVRSGNVKDVNDPTFSECEATLGNTTANPSTPARSSSNDAAGHRTTATSVVR